MNSVVEKYTKINKYAILSIIFTLLIFTAIIAYILSIINIMIIGGTDWKNSELNQSKNGFTATSIVCIILFTPIVSSIISLVWVNKCRRNIEVTVINN